MATIQKWGNSLAIRIPAALAAQLNVKAGMPVDITADDGTIVVRPQKRPKLRLGELLRDCKPSQLHGEIDWGTDVGREAVEE
jgi:antitoxin MazE